jgi:hypothetical protein
MTGSNAQEVASRRRAGRGERRVIFTPTPHAALDAGDDKPRPASILRPNIEVPDADGVGGVRIVAGSVSHAWIGAFSALMQPGVSSIEPLVVTVSGTDATALLHEHFDVASLINAELRAGYGAEVRRTGRQPKHPPLTVLTTANTIFPDSLWAPGLSRHAFYAKYMRMLPRLKQDSRNRRGIYFERMINYGRGPEGGNQLEHIFRAFEKKVRRTSAYQVSIADPLTDLTKTPFLGFPCLQQIAVHPSERSGTLSLTGFYGTQYLFERGYGNLLGLCRLGRFLAYEMGLRLTRMTCVASHVPVEAIGKARGRALLGALSPSEGGQWACAASNSELGEAPSGD